MSEEPEQQVTAEMIEAGRQELAAYDYDRDNGDEVVRKIYAAMEAERLRMIARSILWSAGDMGNCDRYLVRRIIQRALRAGAYENTKGLSP
jgi:hypothetical protein